MAWRAAARRGAWWAAQGCLGVGGAGVRGRADGTMRRLCSGLAGSGAREGGGRLQEPIAVAVSGGVDSSVAALLLKREGYRVFGVHMRNWDEEEERGAHRGPGVCSSAQDLQDAKDTCRHLGMELREVGFVKEYWNRVFEPTLEGYLRGVTPNPDVMCNREIKFSLLLEAVRGMGAGTLATGHYARLGRARAGGVRLLRGVDESKDQTYFLSSVTAKQLEGAAFPLGGLTKEQVKEIARREGLPTAGKRESMGLCFVGKRNFKQFIQQYVPRGKGGRFVSTEGQVVGSHDGAYLFTVGQGAKIGGQAEKWFVASTDVLSGDVVVARGTDHPSLYTSVFEASGVSWVSECDPPYPLACRVRVRHQQPLVEAVLTGGRGGGFRVVLGEPVRAVAPGQVVVVYVGDECLGCGVISKAGDSTV